MGMSIYFEIMDGDAPGFQDVVQDCQKWYDASPATDTAVEVVALSWYRHIVGTLLTPEWLENEGVVKGGYTSFIDDLKGKLGVLKDNEDPTDEDTASSIEDLEFLINAFETTEVPFSNKQVFFISF